ncbi:MAG: hypothetical protein CME55_02695 [Halieaceae bacterium]|nr:hypothetical protein [Halieaceae bacterium]
MPFKPPNAEWSLPAAESGALANLEHRQHRIEKQRHRKKTLLTVFEVTGNLLVRLRASVCGPNIAYRQRYGAM